MHFVHPHTTSASMQLSSYDEAVNQCLHYYVEATQRDHSATSGGTVAGLAFGPTLSRRLILIPVRSIMCIWGWW